MGVMFVFFQFGLFIDVEQFYLTLTLSFKGEGTKTHSLMERTF